MNLLLTLRLLTAILLCLSRDFKVGLHPLLVCSVSKIIRANEIYNNLLIKYN